MKNLIDTLKILTGRKLSERQMKNAVPKEEVNYLRETQDGKTITELHRLPSGEFALYKSSFKWITTSSYSNYAVDEAVKRKYNPQGFLTEKRIDYSPQFNWKGIVIIYSPSGSFFGELDTKSFFDKLNEKGGR